MQIKAEYIFNLTYEGNKCTNIVESYSMQIKAVYILISQCIKDKNLNNVGRLLFYLSIQNDVLALYSYLVLIIFLFEFKKIYIFIDF